MSNVPTGWTSARVGDLGGPKARRAVNFSGERPYLATADVAGGQARPSESVTFSGRPARADLLLRPGDVLQARMRGTDKALLVGPDLDGVLASTGFAQFQPAAAAVDPQFLYQYLQSDGFLRWRDRLSVGSTQQAISDRDLSSIEVSLPALPEQVRLGELLSFIDDEIRLSRQVLVKLEAVETGLMRTLLEEARLSNPTVPLGDIAHVDRGKFGHRPRNDPAYLGGAFAFIQTGDVSAARGGIIVDASQSLSALGARVSREFPAGTIAVTIAANIADTAILGRPMYFPDSVVGVIVRRPHSIRYVEMSIRSAKPRLEARAPQSAQRNINLQDLRPLLIPLPSPAEQERIERIYDAHAKALHAQRVHIAKLLHLKRGLVTDLFSGHARVKKGLAS